MGRVVEKELSAFEQYKTVVLIDISWVMHRSLRAFPELSVDIGGRKIPTGHIYGVLDSVKKTLKASKEGKTAVILVRDGRPVERQKLVTSVGGVYKAGRPELEYDIFQDTARIVKLASKHSDVYYSYHSDKESDDVLYCISKRMKRRLVNPDMWIYSGDNDLLQAISPRISMFRVFDKGSGGWIPITEENVKNDEVFTKKFKGVGPNKLPLFRTIVGDSSDNLKGIDRFPRDLLLALVDKSKDIEEMIYLAGHCKVKKESWKKYLDMIVQEQDRLRVMYKVMKLEEDFVPKIMRVLISDEEFYGLCNRYRINAWKNYIEECRLWQSY